MADALKSNCLKSPAIKIPLFGNWALILFRDDVKYSFNARIWTVLVLPSQTAFQYGINNNDRNIFVYICQLRSFRTCSSVVRLFTSVRLLIFQLFCDFFPSKRDLRHGDLVPLSLCCSVVLHSLRSDLPIIVKASFDDVVYHDH